VASSSDWSFRGEVTTKAAAESALERRRVKERAREVQRRRRGLGMESLGKRGIVSFGDGRRRRKRLGV